jgi:enoyl-CoA hydratase/carnithine racemase
LGQIAWLCLGRWLLGPPAYYARVPTTPVLRVRPIEMPSPSLQQVFGGLVEMTVADGVALLTMMDSGDGSRCFEWGTAVREHRWNPLLIGALGQALDAVEALPESSCGCVVVGNAGKFWSNGMDLQYLDSATPAENAAHELATNALMARVLTFPIPSIAAISGHFCAAGAMMGLCFDYRIMSNDRGFFFIPGVDIGLVYSPLQTAVMMAKLPPRMHRDVIIYNSKRWVAAELVAEGLVESAYPAGAAVTEAALELAATLKPKGQGAARQAMGGIKRRVYRGVLEALEEGGAMDVGGRTAGVDRPPPSAMQGPGGGGATATTPPPTTTAAKL